MTAAPHRPWWRKKRWLAAGLLWLVLAYPLGRGPAAYAVVRGWLPVAYEQTLYAPLEAVLPRDSPPTKTLVFLNGAHFVLCRPPNPRAVWLYRYVDWWTALARR